MAVIDNYEEMYKIAKQYKNPMLAVEILGKWKYILAAEIGKILRKETVRQHTAQDVEVLEDAVEKAHP